MSDNQYEACQDRLVNTLQGYGGGNTDSGSLKSRELWYRAVIELMSVDVGGADVQLHAQFFATSVEQASIPQNLASRGTQIPRHHPPAEHRPAPISHHPSRYRVNPHSL